MLHTHYYIIRAKDTFLQAYQQYQPLYLPYAPVQLWRAEEAGRNPAFNRQHVLEAHKIKYLAHQGTLMRLAEKEAGAAHPYNDYKFLKFLMGEAPYHATLFDQWWTIEYIPFTGDFNVTLAHTPAELLQRFMPYDEPAIERWLEDMIRLKTESAARPEE